MNMLLNEIKNNFKGNVNLRHITGGKILVEQ